MNTEEKRSNDRGQQFREGFRDGVPIALGYLAVAFTLGIQAKEAGMSVWEATVMSLVNVTSAGEFAALTIISSASSYLEMAISQLIINLRYMLMSFALSQKVSPELSVPHRMGMAFGVTDEIFGISVGRDGALSPFYNYGAMSIALPGWTVGTALGVVMGNVLPDSVVSALSLALYGMFLAIIIPKAREDKHVLAAVIVAMAASWLCTKLPVVREISAGTRIILLTVIISLIAALVFPVKDEQEAGEHE
ncbi:MAG: AzlC family ABC transporter permease [Lachnospiraceae bacterium]|nr:AzlC family ABC transporter permease [Lachnospiraceae bacterium]MBO6208965.1 AzlC family ABC transporter permease [Lachnospiraceae bacterium]